MFLSVIFLSSGFGSANLFTKIFLDTTQRVKEPQNEYYYMNIFHFYFFPNVINKSVPTFKYVARASQTIK